MGSEREIPLEHQQYYPSKDVCDRFDISGSTLRKWCLSLEDHDYDFTRTEQNRRLFTDHDITVLDHLRELVQVKRMSLDNASTIVASRFNDDRSSAGTPSVLDGDDVDNNEVIDRLNEHIEKQEQFNQELLRRLDQQNEYIKKSIDNRDKQLMETLKGLGEQRKEEIKLLEEVREEKGNWFTRLFKK